MGAKVYNDLPLEVRKIEYYRDFEKKINEHSNLLTLSEFLMYTV